MDCSALAAHVMSWACRLKTQELKNIRRLAHEVLLQRSDVETFLVSSLKQVLPLTRKLQDILLTCSAAQCCVLSFPGSPSSARGRHATSSGHCMLHCQKPRLSRIWVTASHATHAPFCTLSEGAQVTASGNTCYTCTALRSKTAQVYPWL